MDAEGFPPRHSQSNATDRADHEDGDEAAMLRRRDTTLCSCLVSIYRRHGGTMAVDLYNQTNLS